MVVRTLYNVGVAAAQRAIHPHKYQALNGIGFIRPHVWKGRCGPFDIGLNGVMDQTAATYNMENARWAMGMYVFVNYSDLSRKCSLGSGLQQAISKKWGWVAGFNTMNMLEEIPFGKAYEIHTYVTYWEKEGAWWFFDHTFICPETGNVLAKGMEILRCSCRNDVESGCRHDSYHLAQLEKGKNPHAAILGAHGCHPRAPRRNARNVKAYLELDNQTRIRMESWRGKEEFQPSPLSELPVEISHK
ncbi:hypothetical protein AeMF1_004492 [Aphanomyces euteiches]|nr:hypothetical protein AeMF1_004492 [Aphanomyces euteiches]